jgi:flagellin
MDGLLWTPSKEETIMGLQINTNIGAMNAYRNLATTQNAMSTSLERLSSGLRINRAADDAAGLGISEKLRAQTNGLNQATANAQDGISLIQTAEGALNESHSILQRMRQLAVQSATDTNTDADRTQIQKEVSQLSLELDRLAGATQFNGQNLLDGTFSAKTFQIGANAGQNLAVSIGKMDTSATGLALAAGLASKAGNGVVGTPVAGAPLGNFNVIANGDIQDSSGLKVGAYAAGTANFTDATLGDVTFASTILNGADGVGTGSFSITNGVNVATKAGATSSITALDSAINAVSGQRADLGAVQNRLQHTVNSLSVAAENASAAESRIRDTDMAKEMTSFTRSQILQQAGVSMLAQANSAPQSVLKLLG